MLVLVLVPNCTFQYLAVTYGLKFSLWKRLKKRFREFKMNHTSLVPSSDLGHCETLLLRVICCFGFKVIVYNTYFITGSKPVQKWVYVVCMFMRQVHIATDCLCVTHSRTLGTFPIFSSDDTYHYSWNKSFQNVMSSKIVLDDIHFIRKIIFKGKKSSYCVLD